MEKLEIKEITSVNNKHIKDLFKLHEKKYRDTEEMFLIEGYHLLLEARENLLEVLFVDEKDYIEGVTNYKVTKEIIEKLSKTKSPQNIIGVCRYFNDVEISQTDNKFLLLDDVQDPGNLGTLVRSALGFGIDIVILNNNSVDIYNDKFIRSSQGAIFKIKLLKKNLVDVIDLIKKKNIKVYGTSVVNGTTLDNIEKSNDYAIVLGNEGNGVSKEIIDICDENIYIKTNKSLESLNVSVAGSIIMYEFSK